MVITPQDHRKHTIWWGSQVNAIISRINHAYLSNPESVGWGENNENKKYGEKAIGAAEMCDH